MDSARGDLLRRPGSPIRASADRSLFADSPRLFAGSYALRRLLPPRHPPCALVRLAIQPQPAWPGRTRLLSTSLRFLHSLFFLAQALPQPPAGLPARRTSAPARTSRTVKESGGPRGRRKAVADPQAHASRACGSPPPSAVAGVPPFAPAFCLVAFLPVLLDLSFLIFSCLPRPRFPGSPCSPAFGRPLGQRPRSPLVEPGRIELPTSCVQGRRSPS